MRKQQCRISPWVLVAAAAMLVARAWPGEVRAAADPLSWTKLEPRYTYPWEQQKEAHQRKSGPQPVSSKSGPKSPEPSDSGYIDNAIVGNQVRVRVNIARDGNRPDRAEFFYGRCICYNALAEAFGPRVSDPRAADSPGPADDVDYVEVRTYIEYAFHPRFSFFVDVPIRSVSLTENHVTIDGMLFPGRGEISRTGLSALEVGGKVALFSDESKDLTYQFRFYLPTGDARDALGNNHVSWEPSLLYFQRLSSRTKLAAEVRWWHPRGGSPAQELNLPTENLPVRVGEFAGDILRYGVGLSHNVAGGHRVGVTPVLELVAWSVLGGGATSPQGKLEPANTTIVNLKPGVRLRLLSRHSIYLGYGFALTDDIWYDDIFRIEYRVAF